MAHAADNNDKTLIPHADIDKNGNAEQPGDRGPDTLEKEEQRDHGVADDHDPESNGIVAGGPVFEDRHFHGIMAVPGDEKFRAIGKSHNQPGKNDGFGDAFQNLDGDNFFIMKNFSKRNHQGQHHGQSRVDGAGHEIGCKNRGVPAGNNAQRKIPGHHAVNGNDQGGCQGGKKQIAAGIMPPLFMCAGPSQGENGKDFFADSRCPIPDGGQIRQHAGVPEQGTDGQIGADGNDIEHQRRLKIGPQGPLVGHRQHVKDHPDAAQMNKRKKTRSTDRENRHGFGGPGNGISPARPEQVQNGGDQGPRVGDTDPEHEIDQIGSPGHRVVLSAHADTRQYLINPAAGTEKHPQKRIPTVTQ